MIQCDQTPGVSVLDHGFQVSESYRSLLDKLRNRDCEEVSIQELYDRRKHELLPDDVMQTYHVFHDCGKPFCSPENGKKFPNHELHSYNQWILLFPDDKTIAEMMLNDMKFHLAGNDDYLSHPNAFSSYITAWAELYANSKMFGGMSSDSYKIKRKRLLKYGKKM